MGQFASEELRGCRELVLDAIRQDGLAFKFASESLRADRELALEAVRREGWALRYAAEDLRSDGEVIYEAAQMSHKLVGTLPLSSVSLHSENNAGALDCM